jgi:hypothetical protein
VENLAEGVVVAGKFLNEVTKIAPELLIVGGI